MSDGLQREILDADSGAQFNYEKYFFGEPRRIFSPKTPRPEKCFSLKFNFIYADAKVFHRKKKNFFLITAERSRKINRKSLMREGGPSAG